MQWIEVRKEDGVKEVEERDRRNEEREERLD